MNNTIVGTHRIALSVYMLKARNLQFIVFLIAALLFSFAQAAVKCESLFKRKGKTEAVLQFENSTQSLKNKIRELDNRLKENLGKSLYSPVCFKASKAFGEILLSELGSKTVFVGTSFYGDFPHYYLIIPNYYGYGEHFYIDPTLQQFFKTQVPDPIFVGSKAELLAFAKEHGAFEYNSRFRADYFGMKNPPGSSLSQFRQDDYPTQ
jgi:hypothetical protein